MSRSGLLAVLKQPCGVSGGSPSLWTREHCRQASQQTHKQVLADLATEDWASVQPWASSELLMQLKAAKQSQINLMGYLLSQPDLCGMIAARGQLDVLKWMFHQPSQQQHAAPQISTALQTAAHLNQTHIVRYLLPCRGQPLTLQDMSVESWYVVMHLVRWARSHASSNSESSSDSNGPLLANPISGLLRQLLDLEPELAQQIASYALLSPPEASGGQ